jgi:lysophospholipase L1-like esterase
MTKPLYILIGIAAMGWGVATTAASAQTDLNIMPLGDSITWGYNGSLTDPASPGGYRDPLYTSLSSEGYSVNYVGVNTENPSTTLTNAGQTAHNGFNGYTIDEVAGNLNGSQGSVDGVSNQGGYWLTGGNGTGRGAESANVILVQLGTNDIAWTYDPLYNFVNPYGAGAEDPSLFAQHMADRLENLVDELQTLEPNATVLVGGIIPFWNNPRAALYDADLQTMIATSMSGENVHYVDLYDSFMSNGAENLALFSGDQLHPNSAGYDVLAQDWNLAIQQDVVAVPEPSTIGLFVLGGIAMLLLRRLPKGALGRLPKFR